MTRLGVTALLLGTLLAGGCGSNAPAGGDPGNKRLHALQADPMFAAVPPGAQGLETKSTEAHYRKPGFDAGGWDGPTVVTTFDSSADPAEVFHFYANRAESAGWRGTAQGSLRITDRWAKTFPENAPATLFLSRQGSTRYQLLGGIAPKG